MNDEEKRRNNKKNYTKKNELNKVNKELTKMKKQNK